MQQKRALITGITGQDGSYLAELLLDKGYAVAGLIKRNATNNFGVLPYKLRDKIEFFHGDLSDTSSIARALDLFGPDEVYNLAAQSHVGLSFEIPEYTGDVTGLGTLRILEQIRLLGLNCRFYQASSSELFGEVLETPQNELTPFNPRSPYAAAKAYAHYITKNYRESYNIFACSGILFNHESPRRGNQFVTRKITKAANAINIGMQETLKLGNLDAKRDWGYSGDYVKAMWLMLQQDYPKDYVIATGETYSVREFCELAFSHLGINITWKGEGKDEVGINTKKGKTIIEVDPKFYRPAEVDVLVGDSSKARNELGWKPETTFKELVKKMVISDNPFSS